MIKRLVQRSGNILGFKLIGAYQEANPGQTAASLVNANAELFRPD